MSNRRTFEYFVSALVVGLGVPICALVGARDGEQLARAAYPPPAQAAPEAPKDFARIVLASDGSAERGKTLFQNNCAACHGAAADGKGPAAAALKPPPRDFQDPAAKWTGGRQPADLYAVISAGSPGTAMPGFAVSIPVADRWAIIHYLATLPGVKGQYVPMDAIAAAAWRP